MTAEIVTGVAYVPSRHISLPQLDRVNSGFAGWGYHNIAAGIVAHYDPGTSKAEPLRLLEAGRESDCWLPLSPGTENTTQVDAIGARSRYLLTAYRAGEMLLGILTLGRTETRMADLFMIARRH